MKKKIFIVSAMAILAVLAFFGDYMFAVVYPDLAGYTRIGDWQMLGYSLHIGYTKDADAGTHHYYDMGCPANDLCAYAICGKLYGDTTPNDAYNICNFAAVKRGEVNTVRFSNVMPKYLWLVKYSKVPSTTTTTIPPEQPPEPELQTPLEWLMGKIADFIQWLKSLLGFQVLSAKEAYQAGTYAEFDVDIQLLPIDSDYTDGTVQKRYGLWFITDADGNVVDVSDWQEVTDSYAVSPTVQAKPEGTYYFVALVNQHQGTWDMGAKSWSYAEPVTIAKESVAFETYDITPPPAPQLPNIFEWISNTISGFLEWLRGLFPWAF